MPRQTSTLSIFILSMQITALLVPAACISESEPVDDESVSAAFESDDPPPPPPRPACEPGVTSYCGYGTEPGQYACCNDGDTCHTGADDGGHSWFYCTPPNPGCGPGLIACGTRSDGTPAA